MNMNNEGVKCQHIHYRTGKAAQVHWDTWCNLRIKYVDHDTIFCLNSTRTRTVCFVEIHPLNILHFFSFSFPVVFNNLHLKIMLSMMWPLPQLFLETVFLLHIIHNLNTLKSPDSLIFEAETEYTHYGNVLSPAGLTYFYHIVE